METYTEDMLKVLDSIERDQNLTSLHFTRYRQQITRELLAQGIIDDSTKDGLMIDHDERIPALRAKYAGKS